MSGLDQVKDILPRPVHDSGEQTKADCTTPKGGCRAKSVITEDADAIADTGPRPGNKNIADSDTEIDGHSQHDEWHGAHHHGECAANVKIPHGCLFSVLCGSLAGAGGYRPV